MAAIRDIDMTEDLSALAWVQEELRRSLEAAHKALRRYLKEAAGASDVDTVDPAVLRQARNQIHQGAGALELVGLPTAARVLRAAEAALQRLAGKPRLINAAAVETIERGSFALLDYLTRLLAGKAVSPLAMFPQYKALQELAAASRVHPADLWPTDWEWRPLPAEPGVAPLAADAATVSRVESEMLTLMRGLDVQASARMSALFAGLAAGSNGHLATLWHLAAAFYEAQAAGVLAPDVYGKRVGSRLLSQLRAGRGADASDRLAQDLLFFCAQVPADGEARTPRLDAVRRAYALAAQPPVDYATARLGRFDPAYLAQARKRLAGAKDVWSAIAGGDLLRLPTVPEQFSLVGDSLQRLYPEGDVLAQALQAAAARTAAAGEAPPAELAMEVATGLLYLDAAFEDGDIDHPEAAERARRLAQRVDSVREGQPPQPLEAWMEDLYRRVSDRQTMGSVVQELRASLSEIEKQIDQYFRDPAQREVLIPVPAQLSSMRGVFSVLGLDPASQAVVRMRDDVDALAQTEVDPARAIQAGTFDRLADNLGALSFLIDMLSVQPAMAKSLFRFDAGSGLLIAKMGLAHRHTDFGGLEGAVAPAPQVPPLVARAQSIAAAAAEPGIGDEVLARDLEALSRDAEASAEQPLAEVAHRALETLERASGFGDTGPARLDVASSLQDFVATRSGALADEPAPQSRPAPLAAAVPAPPAPTGLEDDDEMRGIFLEEAREVVQAARDGLAELRLQAGDVAAMTSVRRAFHTLKGSSRMVGLGEFGEAAWSCEQLYNTRLAAAAGADADLIGFSGEVLDHLSSWIDAIEARTDGGFAHAVVSVPADELRKHGRRLPLGGAAPAALEAMPLPAGEGAALAHPALAAVPEIPEVHEVHEPPAAPAGAAAPNAPAVPGLELPPAPAVPPLTLRVPDLPSAADLDLSLADLPPADFSSAAPAAAPASLPEVAELDFRLDLGALDAPGSLPDLDLGDSWEAPAAASAADASAVPAAAIADLALDFDLPAAQAAAPAAEPPAAPADEPPPAAEPAPEFEPLPVAEASTLLDSGWHSLELPPLPPVAEPLAEAPAGLPAQALADLPDDLPDDLPADHPSAALPGESAPEAPAAAADDAAEDETFKVIGPLRIAIPLFNIYLNEADEQSRRLVTEIAEWSHELHRAPGESTVALAHSLAGNSATVGYTDLSQLARALEHALMRSNQAQGGTADEAALFGEAAEEVRRLLHQFAAGFLRPVDAGLLQRLTDHEHEQAQRLQAQPATEISTPDFDSLSTTVLAQLPGTQFADFGQAELKSFADLPEPAARPVHARADLLDDEDDIDAVDAVDAELFPIFEEEGQELVPQLQSRLREWMRRPTEAAAASACMRTLHTLKGGARLAGAMRLGEMAHRLETAIEHLLARGHVGAAEVEKLVARADSIETAFEALRRGEPLASQPMPLAAEPPAMPLPVAPPPPVAAPQPLPPAPPAAVAPVVATLAPTPAPTPTPAPAPTPTPTPATEPAPAPAIDWRRLAAAPATAAEAEPAARAGGIAQSAVRVRAPLLDRLVSHAGEVSITRARIESEVGHMKSSLGDLAENLERLRRQLRDIELQAETQISSRMEAAKAMSQAFDPLEMDRFTRFQELTRMMAESVNDVATVQRGLQRTLQSAEDELAAQGRLTRDLQDDLLRTRMVEFEGLSERLYRVVRLAAKETGKQVRLDIAGGAIEIDRGVLDRMVPAFEHLLRNCVTHGIERPELRQAAGKDATGTITIVLTQEGNEVGVEVRDDGAGLDLAAIRDKGIAMGLLAPDAPATDAELANLIFTPGFSTAREITELAGRGVGMDVVRTDVNAMGGRIETATAAGQGTSFRVVLPLTTAVTQVVLLRCGEVQVAVPSTLVEIVLRALPAQVEAGYGSGAFGHDGREIPFFWLGALLHSSPRGTLGGRTLPVVIIRSAAQRIALHVDEVLGNQEVVVKNLGPQLARLPGLAGMTLLPSGTPALIYNPVALATLHAEAAWGLMRQGPVAVLPLEQPAAAEAPQAPLVLVVDDSLTVRRVTQRLLLREGYRVALAKDGLEGLERLAEERPAVLLSDIEMPRMDGFDLVRNLRTDPRLADLPVIMITSRIAQKHRDYASELGVDHYLGKPYAEEDLLSLVARYARVAATA